MIEIQPSADKPMPFDLSDEQPKTHADSVAIAVNTVDLVEKLGASIDYDAKDFQAAAALAAGKVKTNTPTTVSKAGVAKTLAVAVKEHDFQVFADIQQARNFITTKLVALTGCGDAKIEIKALELLGKHSDIGLFTERSEITVHHTSSASLETSIKERVKRLMNAEITDVTPFDDLDAHLGAVGEGTFEDEEDDPEKLIASDTEEDVEDVSAGDTEEDVDEELAQNKNT